LKQLKPQVPVIEISPETQQQTTQQVQSHSITYKSLGNIISLCGISDGEHSLGKGSYEVYMYSK